MNRYICIFFASLLLSPLMASAVSAESFEDFKNGQAEMVRRENGFSGQQGFERYKQGLQTEFDAYRQIVAEEYADFKRKLRQKWDDAEVSSKKRWVEYAADLNDRRIVDFEEGYIRIDLIAAAAETRFDRVIETKLADLVREDQKTAFERDALSRNIEKRIAAQSATVARAPVEAAPVLTRVITGTETPSKAQVARAVAELQRQATVTETQSKSAGKKVVSVKIPLPPDSIRKKAREYGPDVKGAADRRGLDAALIFAVIHTESAFNPMARSHVPAYGLMQIVPQSAGKDAAGLLFDEPRLLAPSYLYNGRNNIEIGAAYLYILWNRYLKKIESPESRLYCAIAAYNTGAGNVAKAFVGSTNVGKAAAVINRMRPEQVYEHLKRHLPYGETRDYLDRVVRRMQMYASM